MYLPFRPIKGQEFTLYYGYGGFFSSADQDNVRVSKDGGSYASATNSPTDIGNGILSIVLTAAEMDADVICINSSASGSEAIGVIIIYTMPGELSAIPSATSLLHLKIQAIFQYLFYRRTVTASAETLYKDDGTTSLGSNTLSDNGTTFDKGEVG